MNYENELIKGAKTEREGLVMIYLDNGATSFPKPNQVLESFIEATNKYCGNPGRAGHDMAMKTAREIYRTRKTLAEFFNIEDANRLIFTKNCTEGINLALKGVLREGDHVVTTTMEHNAVVRTLDELEARGVEVTFIRCSKDGRLCIKDLQEGITSKTRMIVVTAASNVIGTKMPLEEIGRLALRKGILFMVDGAQGAGHMNIDVKKSHIDILAISGHKGLMGLQGTGAVYIREGIEVRPLICGGTGTKSMEEKQPDDFPEGFEAGTLNGPGIIALGTAVRYIKKIGVDVIALHENGLAKRLQEGLKRVDGVELYGPKDMNKKTAVVAFNIDGIDCEEVAAILNDEYGIAVRAGYQCSGKAHETMGTEKRGCVRVCPGFYTSEKDIDGLIVAIKNIIRDGSERVNYLR